MPDLVIATHARMRGINCPLFTLSQAEQKQLALDERTNSEVLGGLWDFAISKTHSLTAFQEEIMQTLVSNPSFNQGYFYLKLEELIDKRNSQVHIYLFALSQIAICSNDEELLVRLIKLKEDRYTVSLLAAINSNLPLEKVIALAEQGDAICRQAMRLREQELLRWLASYSAFDLNEISLDWCFKLMQWDW